MGCLMCLGERVPGVMEGNGLSITTKDLGVVYVCVCHVHVSMPGTQDRIITLATRTLAPAACIPPPYFTLYSSM